MKRKTATGKMIAGILAMLLIFGLWSVSFAAEPETADEISVEEVSGEEVWQMVIKAREDFYENQELKDELASEIAARTEVIPAEYFGSQEWDFYTLTHDGQTMKFFMQTIGDPDENGKYPLYLTLHGGGVGSEEGNNDQWINMFGYYAGAVENGIYIACRGITDTWDLHFQAESYPLYDRLIEAMILNYGADPNRVYLLGFSAGGDGVYQIAPRMADRFAAVNMSSGHPNGVSLRNLLNCPISLQAGIRDYYSEDAQRSIRAAEFEQTLSDYRAEYGTGYEHRVYIHVPNGHNYDDSGNSVSCVLADPEEFAERAVPEDMLSSFLDVMEEYGFGRDVMGLSYLSMGTSEEFDEGITKTVTEKFGLKTEEVDANAVRFVSQFTRDPAPETVVWDLSTRAKSRSVQSFYWLAADPSADQGIITAFVDREQNMITVEPDEQVNADFEILFDPRLVDVTRPILIRTPEEVFKFTIDPSMEFLQENMLERGDPELIAVGSIKYSELVSSE